MANACLIEVKFAFDASSRFVGETIICIRACNRGALNLDQVQLQAASFRGRIILVGLVCRDDQLRAPIGVPSPDGLSGKRLRTLR